ncbi:MAG TPA: nuclear transport factor 2 family protein [Steroidobacteraceae bacterium]|jgi:3-phenylpropionate/cinnamic acid dioxygenase small subunit
MQTLEEKVNWLIDRTQISELLYSFARALDTRDFDAYVRNYAEDGFIDLPQPAAGPDARLKIPRAEMSARVPQSFRSYSATHHISSNHQIRIDGDSAASRSYLQAVHVRTPRDHWGAGGWYDCTYRRTPEGWRFVQVRLTALWVSGNVEAL